MKLSLTLLAVAIANTLNAQTIFPWAATIGGSGADVSYAIATDDVCNVYVSGRFSSDTLVLGNDTFYNAGAADALQWTLDYEASK